MLPFTQETVMPEKAHFPNKVDFKFQVDVNLRGVNCLTNVAAHRVSVSQIMVKNKLSVQGVRFVKMPIILSLSRGSQGVYNVYF